ncbi:MAG: penicillin-binding protein activator [Pseudobdellovibrionaceae bacterium]
MMKYSQVCLAAAVAFGVLSCSSGSKGTPQSQSRVIQPRPEPPPRYDVPKSSPEKIFNSARKLFDAKDYNKAYDYYIAAAAGWAGKPREPEAFVWATRSLFRGGRFHETIDLSSQLLKTRTWTEALTSEIFSYNYKSHESIGDVVGALTVAAEIQSTPALSKEAESYRLKANEIIENKLSYAELEKVSANENLGALRAAAFYRLGELALENRDQDEARRNFSKAINVAPQSEAGSRAQEYLNQLEAIRRVEPRTIGVVLPMTGKYTAISQKTLRGIQMGLGLYNNYPSSFKLAVIDSEGNPDNARRGVERLVKEDNVIAVIGSVLSKTAPAVAAKTGELGVPSIALSQKAGITEAGDSVFRNSLTSEMQVRYLVKTAMEDMGMKKFAILFPNDLYGVEFANIFWDEVLARGGSIVGAQSYSNKETDFRYPIQRLVGTYYIENRMEEYNLRLKEWTAAQPRKSARVTPPEDLLPPNVDFDGIFIPDSVKAMGQISAMLSFNGVKGVKLLGTNLWNAPGVAKRAGHFANNLLFVDSFVGTEPRFINSSFVKDYKTIFNEDPGIFEVQGYDAALLLRQLISQGNTGRESLSRALANVKGFPGAVGPLSMTPEREIMRPLVALTLDSSGQVQPLQKMKTP